MPRETCDTCNVRENAERGNWCGYCEHWFCGDCLSVYERGSCKRHYRLKCKTCKQRVDYDSENEDYEKIGDYCSSGYETRNRAKNFFDTEDIMAEFQEELKKLKFLTK